MQNLSGILKELNQCHPEDVNITNPRYLVVGHLLYGIEIDEELEEFFVDLESDEYNLSDYKNKKVLIEGEFTKSEGTFSKLFYVSNIKATKK